MGWDEGSKKSITAVKSPVIVRQTTIHFILIVVKDIQGGLYLEYKAQKRFVVLFLVLVLVFFNHFRIVKE